MNPEQPEDIERHNRNVEATRAAELMLSSSAASSINSLTSSHSFQGSHQPFLHGYHEPMYPPSYHSQPPPSYGSYMGHYNPGPGPPVPTQAGTRPSYPVGSQSTPIRGQIHPGHQSRQHPGPPSHQQPPVPFHTRMQMPPYFSHLQQYSAVPPGQHANHQFPVIMTDDLVSGTQHNGKMSPVRRFFILLCTFDVLFLSLLWIISILVTGRDLTGELTQQVIHYTITASMFDCVVGAAFRFLLCLLFYGILDFSHWCIITTTTAGTVAFLIAKVFKYQWHDQPITYDVMLVLLSFILSWGEAWFFDFRMIPLETKAKEIWGLHGGAVQTQTEDERTPLLAPNGGMLHRYIEGSTLYEGSVGNFYSPFESPDHSDNEDDDFSEDSGIRIPRRFRRRRNQPLSQQEGEYKKIGEELLSAAWRTINSPDWKLEKKLENGDMVQVKQVNGKKVFKLTGYVDISPRKLLEELFYGVDNVISWNPTLTEFRTIQPIDEYTDISYQVCAEAGGGVVSTRDFVNLRHWSLMEGGVYVSAGGSVSHPAMPAQPGRVRGENGPGCWVMRPVESDPNKCLFQWLLDTDLKGWIPQSIIDKALCGAQLDYISHIRTRVETLAKEDQHNTSIGSCTDILDRDQIS